MQRLKRFNGISDLWRRCCWYRIRHATGRAKLFEQCALLRERRCVLGLMQSLKCFIIEDCILV